MKFPTRKKLDDIYPTIVRYIGILLVVAYVVGSFVGMNLPESILVAASGLILYKTVKSNGNSNGGGNGGSK